jgi:hypothetical protein
MYGKIPFAFQLPKVRRLTGNLASSLFSSIKPGSPDAPAVEKFVCSLFMCFLSLCNKFKPAMADMVSERWGSYPDLLESNP